MSEDNTNRDIFAAPAPLRGDVAVDEILDAINAGRAEREFALFQALGIDR